jgi:hypothetical protein
MLSGTLTDMLITSSILALDQELRRKVEADQNAMGQESCRFWIDDAGIGHYRSTLHVTSNVAVSIVDASAQK